MSKKESMYLIFEEDPSFREIPVIVNGAREVTDEYIAYVVSEARAKIHDQLHIDDIERVVFVIDKIINFVPFKKKK